MKKLLCIFLCVLVFAGVLSGCNFNTNYSDNTGNSETETKAKVEEMLTALAAADSQSALSLMYEQTNVSEESLNRMIQYVNGREATELGQLSVSVNNTMGTSGATRKENGTFRVTFDDGEQIYISIQYVSVNGVEGFASFQLVLSIP